MVLVTLVETTSVCLLFGRALHNREARMVTPAMGAAMIGPMYSLPENGAQHGGRWFHLRLSTL